MNERLKKKTKRSSEKKVKKKEMQVCNKNIISLLTIQIIDVQVDRL